MESSPDRLKRIDELFDAALDLPAAQREVFLRDACGQDTELHARVQRLLSAAERQDGVLDAPAADFAAQLVASVKPRTPHETPARIGPYRIVGELGRGGMGTVYLAEREEHFQQRVALKLIRRGLLVDEQLVKRFIEERQILASLEHANIARLLDGGLTEDGMPWYAMEYVEGEPLDRWCDVRRYSLETRLELFCTVCDAVAYAHERQIVHRDLKPSNILVRADGTVKLLDFGIAKLISAEGAADAQVTRTGLRLMTPEYASPEQMRGETVSAASDVYSLGVVLYELLTGRRPHQTTGGDDAAQAVPTQEPPRPSAAVRTTATATAAAHARSTTPARLSERLRGALDDIVLKALSQEAKRRYPTVAALAADVRRYLDGLPVRTRPAARRRVALVLGTAAVALAVVIAVVRPFQTPAPVTPVAPLLAVGLISDYRGGGSADVARPLADLLATNLARVPSLRVISAARIYEIMAQEGAATNPDAGVYSAAARHAGAVMLVDGALYALDTGGFRLDLRRIDVATGELLAAHTVVGNDIFALVDSGTVKITSGVGASTRIGPVADVTTHSEAAYRLYEQGVRAYYRGDYPNARDLLDAALAQDSMFALARYYRGRSENLNSTLGFQHLEKAVQLADRASDRERLIIRAAWGWGQSDPRTLAIADTLAARYPQEPEAHLWAARALQAAADYPAALRRLRRIVEQDTSAHRESTPICTVCDARGDLVNVLVNMDSLGAAERESHTWTRLEPRSPVAWRVLAETLSFRGKFDSARVALHRAVELDRSFGEPVHLAYFYLFEGDYETLDRELREQTLAAAPEIRAEALWYLTISLRRQGRLAEALDASRTQRSLMLEIQPDRGQMQYAYQVSQVLFELGHYSESAALFDSIADAQVGFTPSMRARYQAWPLTLAATSYTAAGDTATVAARIDAIRTFGARSLLARDQKLHHHVRALLLNARGNEEEAIAELRRALLPGLAYTRTNYELARLLVSKGRPAEAVKVLQPAVHSIESSSLYVTRTDVEELLARAWDDAGSPDSALVHYRTVARAWRRADPSLRGRLDAVLGRVSELEAR